MFQEVSLIFILSMNSKREIGKLNQYLDSRISDIKNNITKNIPNIQ